METVKQVEHETSTKRPKPMRQGSRDDFQTPQEAIEILLPYLNKHWVIWECACGKGNLCEAFNKHKFNLIATDVLQGVNFLEYPQRMNFDFDCIVTNPPYSLKDQFLRKCFEIGKPFALLMPLTALEGKTRNSIYRENGGIQLIIPDKRFQFETPDGKGQGAWFATVWYCGNMHLPRDLNFVSI